MRLPHLLWIWINTFSFSLEIDLRWISREEKPFNFPRCANRNSLEFYLLSSVEGIIFNFSFDCGAQPVGTFTSIQLLLLQGSSARSNSHVLAATSSALPHWPGRQMSSGQAVLGVKTHGNHWLCQFNRVNCPDLASFAPLKTMNCQLMAHLFG